MTKIGFQCLLAGIVVCSAFDPMKIDLLKIHFPDLYKNVTCKNIQGVVVACQNIELLGIVWGTCAPDNPCPVFFAPAMRYAFERMLRMINLRQELLPGYTVSVDWHDDHWDGHDAVDLVVRLLKQFPNRYAGVVQGSDPAAALISKIAYHHRIPHIGFHIAASMSDTLRAPMYFRTQSSVQDITPHVIVMFKKFGWKRVAIVYDPRLFQLEQDLFAQGMVKSGIEVAFSLPLQDYPLDRPKIIQQTRATRIKVIFVWGEPNVGSPLICGYITAKPTIAKITLVILPGAPFYLPPSAAFGADPISLSIGPDAPCSQDMVASWAEGSIITTPTMANMAGFMKLNGAPTPPAADHPLTCLPNDGANAGGEFVKWWMTEMKPLIPIPAFPVMNGADSACLFCLLFRNLIYERRVTRADIVAGNQTVFDMQKNFLLGASLNGLIGPISFKANGDMHGIWEFGHVVAGVGRGDATDSKTYDIQMNGPFPQGLARFSLFDEGARNDTFEECKPGHLREGAVRKVDGNLRWSSTCKPCLEGTRYQTTTAAGQGECTPCPAGFFSDAKAALICQQCSPGRFSVEGKSSCSQCGLGRASPKSGSTVCDACQAGMHQNVTGQHRCKPCSLGRFAHQAGSQDCTACPTHMTTQQIGTVTMSMCVCSPGGYKRGMHCVKCPDDMTSTIASTSAKNCFCGADTFKDSPPNNLSCTPCKTGMTCAEGSDMTSYDRFRETGQGSGKEQKRKGQNSAMDEASNKHLETLVYPLVKLGYYSSIAEPLSIYRCESEKICIGGDPGTCGGVYEGLSCGLCPVGMVHGSYTCEECNELEKSYIMFPVLPCLLAPLIFCILYFYSRSEPDTWNGWRKCMASFGFLCVNSYQLLALVVSQDFEWPDVMSSGSTEGGEWKRFGFLAGMDHTFRLPCAGLGGFEKLMVFNSAMPLCAFALGTLTYICTQSAKLAGRPHLSMDLDNAMNTYFGLFFTFFNGIAAMSMELFKCSSNPNGLYTMVSYREIICYQDEWESLLALAIIDILVYCVGALTLFGYVMNKAPRQFQNIRFQQRWKFLFAKFRPDVYWWSFSILAKGVIINLGYVVLKQNFNVLYWVYFALAAYLMQVVLHWPWRHREADVLDVLANLALMACVALAVPWAKSDDSSKEDLGRLGIAVSWSILFVAIVLSLGLVYEGILRRKMYPRTDNNYISKTSIMRSSVEDIRQAASFMSGMDCDRLETMLASLCAFDRMCVVHTGVVCLTEGGLPSAGAKGNKQRVSIKGIFTPKSAEGLEVTI